MLSLAQIFTSLNQFGRVSGSFWKGIWCSFDSAVAINQFIHLLENQNTAVDCKTFLMREDAPLPKARAMLIATEKQVSL